MEGKATFTDFMVIATGTSTRHTASLADHVIKALKGNHHHILGVEGQNSGDWVLVDAGNIIIHIFTAETRKLYNLEKLWSF